MTPGRAGDCVTGEEPWAWGIPFAQGERSPHLLRPLAANTTLSSGLVSDAGPCPGRVLPEQGVVGGGGGRSGPLDHLSQQRLLHSFKTSFQMHPITFYVRAQNQKLRYSSEKLPCLGGT